VQIYDLKWKYAMRKIRNGWSKILHLGLAYNWHHRRLIQPTSNYFQKLGTKQCIFKQTWTIFLLIGWIFFSIMLFCISCIAMDEVWILFWFTSTVQTLYNNKFNVAIKIYAVLFLNKFNPVSQKNGYWFDVKYL